ncbi:drug/metabolite transporter permease [Klebsiella pneumoniae]|nr:drug/metabolite transporter permease [Klebsiella pneumoniae]
MLPASLLVQPTSWHAISASSWAALGYVSLFSMLIGFIFWYKGLAAGGIAASASSSYCSRSSDLAWSAALLHETVSPLMLAVTLGVVLCVVGSRKFGRQRVSAGSPSRD